MLCLTKLVVAFLVIYVRLVNINDNHYNQYQHVCYSKSLAIIQSVFRTEWQRE